MRTKKTARGPYDVTTNAALLLTMQITLLICSTINLKLSKSVMNSAENHDVNIHHLDWSHPSSSLSRLVLIGSKIRYLLHLWHKIQILDVLVSLSLFVMTYCRVEAEPKMMDAGDYQDDRISSSSSNISQLPSQTRIGAAVTMNSLIDFYVHPSSSWRLLLPIQLKILQL